jgi:hypothetical protein
MREPPRSTSGAKSPEATSAQSTSDAALVGDAASGDAAARMEQVIDQFILQDGTEGGEPDIVARLAPRPQNDPDRLPRIVTTSLPLRPPALPGNDRWRRQFIGALRGSDDSAPTAPDGLPPLAQYTRTAPAAGRRDPRDDEQERGHRYRRLPTDAEAQTSLVAGWYTTRHVLAAAVATICVFSTGVLWATHRSESAVDTGGQATEVAIAIPALTTDAGAAPGHPIRNTPVLIREGETPTFASGFVAGGSRQGPPLTGSSMAAGSETALIVPRIINGGEPAHAEPPPPVAPLVRVVPVEPVAVAPGPSTTGTLATTDTSPPLDRDGLTERVARPAEPHRREAAIGPPPAHHAPAHREHPAGVLSAGRVASEPVQSRGAAPKVARGYVPPEGWEMRRQGLRSAPEPEPSTLKKLVGLVWPFGKASTTAQPAKPEAPAVTAPAYSWSDNSRAIP